MILDDDTIVAISTPLGEGGIGIVRLSGKYAISIADKLFHSGKNKKLTNTSSHRITHGFIKNPQTKETVDEVLVSIMRAPDTYTIEDIVEINCHGGISSLRKVLELVVDQGARLAEPGEFTKRAFLNGRIDLSEAEAVLDLIRAKTDESMRIAIDQLKGGLSGKITVLRDRLMEQCALVEAFIDFPEEDIEFTSKKALIGSLNVIVIELESLLKTYDEGRFFREGIAAAIVGKPNVGKSSLLNALLEKDRAIVTEMPGTTRDIIEEYLNINGLPLRIIDTAGIRESHDMAEIEGVKRSLSAIENADLVIALVDGSKELKSEDIGILERIKNRNPVITINKSDLSPAEDDLSERLKPYAAHVLNISAKKGTGIEELKKTIFNSCLKDWKEHKEGIVITNLRHKIALQNANDSLKNSLQSIEANRPVEIIALEMRTALDSLGEIIGAVTTDDILNKIFNDFCVGK